MKRILLMILSISALASLHADTQQAKITDFKSGAACIVNTGIGWICHETENILLTGESSCVFNKEELPCTWYGFEFKYENFTENTNFTCGFKDDGEVVLGNPKGLLENETDSLKYDVPLGSGRFFNPMYTIFNRLGSEEDTKTTYFECTLDGAHVAKFKLTVVKPKLPEHLKNK